MGFRFNHREQQSIEDIFDRLIQPENVEAESRAGEVEPRTALQLSDAFIQAHTVFHDFAEFVLKAPVNLQRSAALTDEEKERLDRFVANHSDFESFSELTEAAASATEASDNEN